MWFSMFRSEQKIMQEYLVEMKEKFFPKLVENLKRILDDLEVETGTELTPYSKVLDEGLIKTLIWQFGIRFLKLNGRLKKLRKNLGMYEEKMAISSRGEDVAGLRDELSSMNLELKREITSLIKEVEPLMKLERLPPRRSTGFGY